MNWKYIKPLEDQALINDFAQAVGFTFPTSFAAAVSEHNGARPEKSVFDTDQTKERTIKSLLSFNKEDKETVWKIADWNRDELSDQYVAFAIDHYGNLICFRKSDQHIIFLDLETLHAEHISDSYDQFMDCLYEV